MPFMNIGFKLCMGCMESNPDGGVCPYCGYAPGTPSLPAYLAPGTVLNERYLVGKLMRYNGEGADYIAFDTVTSSKVTIREYMPDTLCGRNKDSSVIAVKQNCVAQYKAFMSEFVELNKMLAKMRTLSHINPAIDMFGDNNTGYVVFRYVEGINLTKYLRENAGALSWDEVKRIFPPIFTTLSLVHNAGLVHRGISPDNIIINDKNELKLIGFCIADARTANTELASEVYSGYAAPEQYSSSNWQGTWTDIYGICALLYRILTGTLPTDAMERVTNDTLVEPRALNPNIPPNVSKVIMNGMALSGEVRIQTVTELVTKLFEEPEFNKPRQAATQTIAIPKQHSTKGPVAEDDDGDDESSSARSPRKRPSRRTVFAVVGISTVCVMGILMGVVMMALDDNSSAVLNGISTTAATSSSIPELTSADESGQETDIDGVTVTSPADQTSAGGVSTMPTLAVIETTVASNAESQSSIRPGATVYIMNDLEGMLYDAIKNTSINENLTVIPEYVYTDDVEKGIIIEQSIEKGSNYEKGAEVVLKISMGPGKAVVPDFTGLHKKDYFDILNNAGIKYEEKHYSTDKTLNDYVMWLSIDPGETIDLEAGEVLSVFVADNPDSTGTVATTTVTETEPTETSSAWVTTLPMEYFETGVTTTTVTTEETTQTTALTDEPDIIINDDF